MFKLKEFSYTSPLVTGLMYLVGTCIIIFSMTMNPMAWWEWFVCSLFVLYSLKQAYRWLAIEDGHISYSQMLRETHDYYMKERIMVHSDDNIHLTLTQANDFIRHVWKKEGKKVPPIVVFIEGNTCFAGRFTIRIVQDMCTRTVLLHELAHLLCSRTGHRDKFIRTYVALLERHMKLSYNGENLYEFLRLDSPLLRVIDNRVLIRKDENTFAEYDLDCKPVGLIPVCSCDEK